MTTILEIQHAETVADLINTLKSMVDNCDVEGATIDTTYVYIEGLEPVNVRLQVNTLSDNSETADIILS